MTDRFSIVPVDKLLRILLHQLDNKGSILGISKKLFFHPDTNDPFRITHFKEEIETPVGVAAGPHTQLSHNIVAAWLTGARFIELKTIQTLDELDITKPCIDMEDEGYNCEWSQELKIKESLEQYLDAWIIIHILRHKLWGLKSGHPGFTFNMSVGYDLKGIMQENVQWFLDHMADSGEMLQVKLEQLKKIYPEISEIEVNPQLSNHITLSTMHGCPPEEIGKIAAYLIEERKLHTAIKLNPTLLGPQKLREILNKTGFDTFVPDIAFEHDLKYPDALNIIRDLIQKADKSGVEFGLKLTNTLESRNHKNNFPNEDMMYMSGRALHPISVNLAAKLQAEFNGELNLSFSGGAQAENIVELFECGLAPITVCTDLLKPGGYGRINQYIDNLKNCQPDNDKKTTLKKLISYADKVKNETKYQRTQIADKNLKTLRKLDYFDCIHAPCVDTCPTNQDIPDYLYFTANGAFEKASKVIRETNPFPLTTGMICDHLCQNKCVRIHYDSAVKIRDVKRFIAEYAQNHQNEEKKPGLQPIELKVAIIGAGPSGLTCAWFLAKKGIEVKIFEAQKDPGGMISHAIPAFRLTEEAIQLDIEKIKNAGVQIAYGTHIDKKTFENIRKEFDAVYIGAGAQDSAKLRLKGIETDNVLDPLDILFKVKAGDRTNLGKNIVIIGGGNTAMDAARTALRLVEAGGNVTILYRRTIRQMPADQGEIKAVLEEGTRVLELYNPIEVLSENGKVSAIRCQRMKLGPPDLSGRPRPLPIENEFELIPADCLIPAVGQEKAFDFLKQEHIIRGRYETAIPGVFIGGDAMRGASTAINAIGDGRKAAAEILEKLGNKPDVPNYTVRQKADPEELMIHKTKRINGVEELATGVDKKFDFEVIHEGLSMEEAVYESERCLRCDELCNLCVTVCPNLAFHSFDIEPRQHSIQKIHQDNGEAVVENEGSFRLKQDHQILHIADWCNKCGNCNTFCPSKDAPYKNKAHLYLDKSEFNKEQDGFFTEFESTQSVIEGYFDKKKYRLVDKVDHYLYSSDDFKLILQKEDLQIREIIRFESNESINTEKAAIMQVILEGSLDFFS